MADSDQGHVAVGFPKGSLGEYALVCGDPARAERISRRLKNVEEISRRRGRLAFAGELDGVRVGVASHGVGCAEAAIVFERMFRSGVKTIIRVGTAGSLSPTIKEGDVVIATGAVREDGVTPQLVPISFPAVANHNVTAALERAAADAKVNYATGIVVTIGAFFPGLVELSKDIFAKAGACACEMECSALFTLASIRGARAGAILAIDGSALNVDVETYNPERDVVREGVERAIGVSLEALRFLIRNQ
ncbi:MAG: nucleoside phosphorylase [Bacillota bacterium]